MRNFIIVSVFALLLSGLLFSSCKYSTEWKDINIENEYSLSVPPYTKKKNNLHPDAKLQYANRFRNVYVIVLDDAKEGSFKSYQQDAVKVITQYLEKPVIYDSTAVDVNGQPGYLAQVMGNMDDETIYYDHLTVNGKNGYYQICSWVRSTSRRDQYEGDMRQMLFSFKEL